MDIKVDINLCRICLKSNAGHSILRDTNLVDKFQFVTQLKVAKNDGMPSVFCNNCVAKLKISYDFKRLCINSEVQMKAFLSKINSEFKHFTNNAVKYAKDDAYNETEMSILIDEGFKKESSSQNYQKNIKQECILEQTACNAVEMTPHNEIESSDIRDSNDVNTSIHYNSAVQTIESIDDFSKYIQEDEIEEEDTHEMQSNGNQLRDDYLIDSNEEGHMELPDSGTRSDNTEDNDCENSMEPDMHEEIQMIEDTSQNNILNDNEDDENEDLLGNSSQILFIQADSQLQETYKINNIMQLPNDEKKDFLKDDGNHIITTRVSDSPIETDFFSGSNISNHSEDISNSPSKTSIGKVSKPGYNENQRNINRSHICIKCDKDFSTKTNLMRHMQTHDGVKPFQCNICGNGFTQNGSLKAHMLIHTGERPHQCNVCGRGFTQSKSLTFHMRRHTGEKPYSCSTCGLNFRQKDGLKRHEQIKHANIPLQSHTCSICSRNFHSRYSLQLHIRKHNMNTAEAKVLECSECDKKFPTRFALAEHQRTHTGEKPFKCGDCEKEFARKTSLLTHLKTHLKNHQDGKHIKCELCSKEFSNLSEYVVHANNHETQTNSKIFQCGKCFKSFFIKKNLLQHLRNHNIGITDLYKCTDCSIGFNTKRDLKLHRYNEHKEIVTDLNECEYCNIPFVNAYDLNQHINNVHDTIDEKCDLCLEHFTSKKLYDDHILEHEILTIT